jgi:hypothetical protein
MLPTEVAACDHPEDDAADQRCIEQIKEFLNARTLAWADGSTVTHTAFSMALAELEIESLGPIVGEALGFSRDNEVLDADEEQAATSPIETTWRVGSALVHLSTCFDGDSVTVRPDACVDQ